MYKRIEEISLNTWPALQSVLMEGWVLRTAAGYTKRSNSVNPLYGPETFGDELDLLQKIRLAEQYYEAAGLDCIFKITPYATPSGLDGVLAGLGYDIVQPSSVRTVALQTLPSQPGKHSLLIREELDEEWLKVFAGLSELSALSRSTLRSMLSSSSLKQGYALLLKDNVPAACGLAVIQHGYAGFYDIITAPVYRRQGLAEEMIIGMLHWAKSHGADTAFLQVVKENAQASALYDKLGFSEMYSYWYRVISSNRKKETACRSIGVSVLPGKG